MSDAYSETARELLIYAIYVGRVQVMFVCNVRRSRHPPFNVPFDVLRVATGSANLEEEPS